MVETITANEQRRQNASAIYIALVSAAIAFWGANLSIDPLVVVAPVTVGSLLWALKMFYFRSLARAKFAVIAEIEKDWELKPFEMEWRLFKSSNMSWARPGLSLLEMLIPTLIFAAGIIYLIFRLSELKPG
jgi:hypothetical protein